MSNLNHYLLINLIKIKVSLLPNFIPFFQLLIKLLDLLLKIKIE